MRVSTSMAFDLATRALSRQQSELAKIQEQMATGQRVLNPADDPSAAADAVNLRSAIARNGQYLATQDAARDSLTRIEATLGSFGDQLEDVRAVLIQAGNGTFTVQDRAVLAADLEARANALLGLANTRDSRGAYLFSGLQDGTPAFARVGGTVSYQGDQGWRELQIADGRSLPVTASGAAIFERVRQGNGIFEVGAAATNAGSGVISGGPVVDATAVTGERFELRFAGSGASRTYDVVNATTGSTVSSGTAYTPGTAITVGGMRVEVTGDPAAGDVFTIAPASQRSVFATLVEAARLLRAPSGSAAEKAQLQTGLGGVVAGIDRSLEAVIQARSGAGAGLRELDTVTAYAEGRAVDLQTRLSERADVDYTSAVTEMTRLQTASQATQKAFVASMNRSLFDLI